MDQVYEVIKVTGGIADNAVRGVLKVFTPAGPLEQPLIKTPPPPKVMVRNKIILIA